MLPTYVKPGSKIYCGGRSGSVAYRAKKGSAKGFITAANIVGGSGASVQLTSDGANIGTVPWSGAYGFGGNLDAAFVEVNGQYEGSLTTERGTTLSTQIGNPVIGASVIYEGAISSGSGTVETTYGSFYDREGILFTNSLFVNCGLTLPQHGDSGGICYTLYDLPVGCIQGFFENSTRAIFCQAMYINPAFDLTMY